MFQFYHFGEASNHYDDEPPESEIKPDEDDDPATVAAKAARQAAWEKKRLEAHAKARQEYLSAPEVLYQSGDFPNRGKNKNAAATARPAHLFFKSSQAPQS